MMFCACDEPRKPARPTGPFIKPKGSYPAPCRYTRVVYDGGRTVRTEWSEDAVAWWPTAEGPMAEEQAPREAMRSLFDEIVKALRIREILEWLSRRLPPSGDAKETPS